MILIIGYGNTLRGDDGVGCHIADCLSESLTNPDVEILSRHQLTPEMVEPISRADLVIFVDADSEGMPGEYKSYRIVPAGDMSSFTHQTNPASLLAASKELYGTYPDAMMFSVVGNCFDYGEVLSTAVANAVPQVIRKIERLIEAEMTSHA